MRSDLTPITITGLPTQVFDTLADVAALHAIGGRRVLYVIDSPRENARTAIDEIAARIPEPLVESKRISGGSYELRTRTGGYVNARTTGASGVRGLTVDTLIIDTTLTERRLLEVLPCLMGSQHHDGPAWYQAARID
ncbi:hypothetical protein [Gordonia caeni]|uniref:Uncharacterized protein n=1 Tax=Gordonia caeni TaxID=1007097 RepID=A0ABP7PBN6_9ACTN